MESLEARIDRLERLIKSMAPKKEQWVGPTVITGMTGWDKRDMERARRNGSVKYRRNPMTNGYQYLVSSVPEHLVKINS